MRRRRGMRAAPAESAGPVVVVPGTADVALTRAQTIVVRVPVEFQPRAVRFTSPVRKH